MKNLLLPLVAFICLTALRTNAQVVDDTNIKFGIWNSLNDNLNQVYPEMNGTLKNFNWSDLETAPNVWNWVSFDSTLTASANSNVPFVYMIYTKQNAPQWLYTNGVPKVDEKDSLGNITGYAPYYANATYKFYFKRMINLVRLHVESLPASVRNKAVGVQACFGSTGDYISYKGTVAPQYDLTTTQFYNLFLEFSTYYYDEYKNTSPKIYIVHNPSNDGESETGWLLQNCPGGWLKQGSMGKGFQLNDEKYKSGWLYNILNTPQGGYNVRSRSEITGGITSTGWWTKQKYKNHFAMMCYDVYWGLDMPNMSEAELSNALYDSSLSFFNKYAQNGNQKNPLLTKNAMCALKDGLDAADAVRFPAATFGTVDRNNTQRYQNIANSYAAFGAKLEDLLVVTKDESTNETASGTNDVGWDLLPGNYERYIHQLTPNTTSIGYWNVQSSDTNTIYGRFARGFDVANGKDAMYFDVDSIFLNYAPLNGQYPVTIDVTYLDNGTGSWKIFYDAQSSSNKALTNVTCTNTGLWKKASFLLSDAYFGNRGTSGSDFYIKSTNSQNVIFSIVELSRPKSDQSDVGLFPAAVPSFDTVCLNSTSVAKSFTLGGQFLDGSNVVVGPLAGYSFSNSSTGVYKDSLIINGYGTSFNKTVYVKLATASLGNFNGNISISGGGVPSKNIVMPGSVVNTVPTLSALVTNITCNGLINGAIDLSLTGGTGPFTYSWSGAGSFNPAGQDITGLSASTYSVTVTSYAGCTTSASYTITQPAALAVNVTGDVMICKNGTTSVYVSATGGTQPYTGTGTFSAPKGASTYTVTDAKGCVGTKSYTVTNGTLVVPGTPGTITGSPDATSLCNGGNFVFSISAVASATSYTWIAPPGSSIVSNGALQATMNKPAGALTDSIFVKANNACGSSPTKAKSLTTVPGNTSAISGTTTAAPAQAGLVYSVTAVSGLSYAWTVPADATIVSGQNTSSITVNWGILAGSVTVKAMNNCSSSSVTSLSVGVIPGVFTSSLTTIPSFGTLCVNAISANNSITLTGSGLNGTDVVVGPLSGYVFSGTANGTYANTFVVSGYGTNISRSVFVKFNPSGTGSYNSSFPISGGGGTPINIAVSGTAVNSSPVLSAAITNLTCNASANGAIDLTTTGGTGPFAYSWSGPGTFSSINQDITALSASTYSVTVTSNAGCTVTGTYPVTEPDLLSVNLAADNMVCSNGTTTVYVTATGGTLPYSGIGNFSAPSGSNTYNVTDANGCLKSKSINIANGTGVVPAKPVNINSPDADATGLCGGGNYIFSTDTVSTATSYTWVTPAGCSILSTTNGGTQITMAAPANFSTGTLSVTANNVCGASIAKTKALTSLPGTPGPITGPTSITASQTGLIYNIPAVPGVSYTWTVPAGASILSGQNTSEVSVKWSTTSGKIKVSVTNNCGSSALATLNVNIATAATLYASTTTVPTFGSLCVNSSVTKSFNVYGVLLNGSNIVVGAVSGYKYSTTSNGTYTSTLTLSGYGTSISQIVYVKFNPTSAVAYNGNIPISGGGGTAFNVAVSGTGVNSNPVLSTVVTNVACFGNQTGAINLTATGGTGPFTFSWSGTSFSSSAEDITGLAAGNYNVVVTALGGCTVSTSATITQQALLNVTASSGAILCNGGTTNVNVSATGGTLPYSGTGTFTVVAGNYNYTVTDANGCSIVKSVSVTQPTAFSASATAGTILCNGATTNVLVGATGGTLPYTGTGTFTVGVGSYSYLVSDANGCSMTKSVTLTQPSPLTMTASAGPTSLAGTAVVTVTASGGVAPYTGVGTFTNTPGTYTYNVTDNNGCTASTSVTISSPTPLIASATAGTILCNGGTTSVNVTATGGIAPYTGTGTFSVGAGTYSYTVTDTYGFTATTTVTVSQPGSLAITASAGTILCSGGTTSVNVSATGGVTPYIGTGIFNVPAGSYNYTVSDANGCNSSRSVTISQPMTLSASASAGATAPNGTALVTVSATGGVEPYTGTGIFTVTPGSYNYTVTDINGCSSSASVNVTELSPLTVSVSGGTILCYNGTATLNVTASGGMAPYTGTGSFTVSAGNYTYTVSDAYGFTATASVTITQPSLLSASGSSGSILCNGGTTTVNVTATGGTLPYSGTGTFTVGAGNYNYTVTDANGCSTIKSVSVTQPSALNATVSAGDILCNGGTTSVLVSATGGTSPYTGMGTFTVGAGSYSYLVSDANGCSVTKTVTITEPSTLTMTASAGPTSLAGTADVTVTASGGTSPYSGTGTFTFAPGTYTFNVTDNNGCTASATVTIASATPLIASATAGTILCNGGTTSVNVTATGGFAPYTGTGTYSVGAGTYVYTITDANGSTANTTVFVTQPEPFVVSASAGTILCNGNTTSVNVSATGGITPYTGTGIFTVSAGSYNYSVSDANGCNSSKSITITQPSLLIASGNSGSILCNGGTTTVNVTATGGTLPYSGTGTFTVGAGNYDYTVTDANGCSTTKSVSVTQPSALNATASAGTILCNGATTTVLVSATGGTSPYTGTGTFTVSAGSYNYAVSDANGCNSSKSVTITQPSLLSASGSSGAILCNGGTTTVNVTATGGTLPYSGTGTFTVGAGNYNYSVTDANGCTASTSVTVSQPAALSVSVSSGSILCNGGSTNVLVSAVGGTAPYTGTGIFSAGAGTSGYTVTDANGCVSNKSISITQPAALIVSATPGTITCIGGTTTVNVSATGGVLPYSGTGSFSASAGTNNYNVTDGNGCQASKSINIANGTQQVPPQPAGIISPTADSTGLCGGGGFSYDIALVNTATSYTWIPPAGCTIGYVAPDGTDILLNVPTGFVTGSLSVTANNVCGSSVASVKVITAVPVQPSPISGLTTVTSLQGALTYSVSAIPGLTYTWTVPSGAVINSGQGTSSVKVKWSDVTGVISCQAVNACGASVASNLTVMVSAGLLSSSVSSLPAFQTVCVNGESNIQSFTITGTDLNLSEVVVGPLAGFKFQTGASQIYYDSLLINNGTTGLTKTISVKFTPSAVGIYNTSIPVRGGGANPIGIAVSATAVNSSPALSAIITNITCSGSKNGAIDLSTTGGTGPFTYSWTGTGTYDPAAQDISGLSPVDYSVTVTSFAGCTTTSTYTVTQPAALTVSLSNDVMVCKNTTTNVYVTASGGTAPYTGIGTFPAPNGSSSYTVTDAKGCVKTNSITVANGVNDIPGRPGAISSTSDAAGLCGGGSFVFTIDTVATATSYTWLPPTGGTITATANSGAQAQATLSVPSNFSADSISVKANNICGSSAFKVKQLTAIAALPAGISGPVTALPSQTGLVYSVVSPTPGLSYTWTVPGAATITAGQNTSSITAKWGVTTGNISVKSVNNCGSSLSTTLSVSVVGGVFTVSPSPLPAFDTICVNGLSASKSFSLSAAGLNGTNVTIGPRTGYVFSSTNTGTYTNSLTISGYGTTISQNVFVKFSPTTVGSFNGNVTISGGGATASSIGVSGVAVNSSPTLSAAITNITCNGSKNGAIDLSITGGTAPFTYAWTGTGTYDPAAQDISGLSPVNYTVIVTSYAGCTTSATYTVTEPTALAVTVTNDVMVCKNTTTNVYVTASGGTAPYTGTGTFTAPNGLSSYPVTDAKGCVKTGSITVPNGAGVAPAAPTVINGAAADAKGLCGGGNFVYSVDPVSTATSYTWTAPAGSTIGSPNNTTQITLTAPTNFSTGTLSVTANNSCGVSAATSKSLSSIPARPDVITGPITVTAQQSGLVYSVPAVAGVTYTWTVPGTGTITSGQGTASVVVKWGNITGNVTCKAGNSCGTSSSRTLSVTVSAVFAAQQFDEAVYTTLSGELSVAPNPAKNYANVSFKAEEANKYTLLLTDLTGKLVQRNEGTAIKGVNRVKLNVSAYANGTYILTLVDQKGKRTTLKLVKE